MHFMTRDQKGLLPAPCTVEQAIPSVVLYFSMSTWPSMMLLLLRGLLEKAAHRLCQGQSSHVDHHHPLTENISGTRRKVTYHSSMGMQSRRTMLLLICDRNRCKVGLANVTSRQGSVYHSSLAVCKILRMVCVGDAPKVDATLVGYVLASPSIDQQMTATEAEQRSCQAVSLTSSACPVC